MADRELVFYHAPFTRSGTIRVLMEELGVEHRMEVLHLRKGEHKTPQYLAINPMGKVPAIVHGDVPITEVAAICTYLGDAFPELGLAPPPGDPRRGTYLRWIFFVAGPLEMCLSDAGLERDPGPPSRIGYGTLESVTNALETAVTPGPWVLGDTFSIADVVLGSTLRWIALSGDIPLGDAAKAYGLRFGEREAVKRAMAADHALAAELKAASE